MKILVTGSNGLLGQKLTACLQTDQSVDLIATSKSDSVGTIQRGKFFRLDITKSDAINDIVTQHQAGRHYQHSSYHPGGPM
jgi:dTDP-4-dehydrorhamnose reductase